MTDFRHIADSFWASAQIDLADVAEAQARGFAMIVNNRPEGEADDQIAGPEIEAAARAAGIDYLALPVTHAGFSEDQVKAMAAALERAPGPVLAFCRSGTRSTLLWSLAEALRGRGVDSIAADAARGGYDVAPVRPLLEMLAGRSH